MTFNKRFVKRVLMCLLGVLICSFSVGMFNLAAFGVDPFQCFAQGSHSVFSQYMNLLCNYQFNNACNYFHLG